MNSFLWAAVTCGAVLIAIGCDRSPAPPNLPESTPNKAPASRPTTQELLSGPRKKLPLLPLPLSAQVPQSWQVKSITENLFFLEGPAPSGDVQIQLAERTSQTAE